MRNSSRWAARGAGTLLNPSPSGSVPPPGKSAWCKTRLPRTLSRAWRSCPTIGISSSAPPSSSCTVPRPANVFASCATKASAPFADVGHNKRMITQNGEIWDLEKLQVIRRLPIAKCVQMTISGDGTCVATTYPLRLWDVATGKAILPQSPTQGYVVDHAVFSPDDQRIFTLAENEGIVRVWDAKTGRSLETISAAIGPGQTDQRGPLRFSRDASQLFIGSRQWDLASKKFLPSLNEKLPKYAVYRPTDRVIMAPDRKIRSEERRVGKECRS